MGVFKEIAVRYSKKIYEYYKIQTDEKLYTGKEAELLIQRNSIARDLIEGLKDIEVKEDDYTIYFQEFLTKINTTFQQVKDQVQEYNKERKTRFTTDLFESILSSSLTNFINALRELHQKSPEIITTITDKSLFKNDRNTPWIYQFSFILYDYILEKEFELAINKGNRDIFDEKIQLIIKYIQNAGELHTRFKNDNDPGYKELMAGLLRNFRSDESKIQQRKTKEPSTSSVYSYFSQTFYMASEKLIGKSLLGDKIDFLIREFQERSPTTTDSLTIF